MNNLVDFRFLEDYNVEQIEKSFNEALSSLDFSKHIKPGVNVLIKVCVPQGADKNTAMCTHPAVVEAIASAVKSKGANCVIAESPYDDYNVKNLQEALDMSEITTAAENAGVDIDYSLKTKNVELPAGVKAKSITMLKSVLDADVVINIGKVKFHKILGYLGASASMFGAVPGDIKKDLLNRLYTQQDFHNLIIDINSALSKKVKLNVLDGIVALESDGSPRIFSSLVFGENPYSVDAFLLHLLNIDHSNTIIKCALDRGVINSNTFKQLGDSLSNINQQSILPHKLNLLEPINRPDFPQSSHYKNHQQVPTIKPNRCKGCGVCCKICPTGAIMMKFDKNGELYASIDYTRCILCKKCVLGCPYKVVKVRTPFAHKRMTKTLEKFNQQD